MRTVLIGVITVSLAACAPTSSDDGATSARPASPDFCGWAAVLVSQVPDAPDALSAAVPDSEPTPGVTMERLSAVADDLRLFADTADETAAHASSADGPHFAAMADFNRMVAEVIGGNETLDTESVEPARRAADEVSDILSSDCGLEFEPSDGLAFVQAP